MVGDLIRGLPTSSAAGTDAIAQGVATGGMVLIVANREPTLDEIADNPVVVQVSCGTIRVVKDNIGGVFLRVVS